jgi:hypothetical protein
VAAVDEIDEKWFRVGDLVEVGPGAPLPAYFWLHPGVQGRVVIADAPTEHEPTEWVTLQVGRRRPTVRLQARWVRLIGRPPRR